MSYVKGLVELLGYKLKMRYKITGITKLLMHNPISKSSYYKNSKKKY